MNNNNEAARLKLQTEFGPQFVFLAMLSGEICGYSFADWRSLDERIETWRSELEGWSRSHVASHWELIWWKAIATDPVRSSAALGTLLRHSPSVWMRSEDA
jgi:hypothetical protein